MMFMNGETQCKSLPWRMDDDAFQGQRDLCVLLNGKKQKARPKGVNLKVRWRAKVARRYRSEESAVPPRYTGVGMS